jgi:proline-specific peptidase
MLAAEHAILKPPGLRRLIIADSPASMVDWVISANKLRKELPKDIQDALTKHEKDGTTDSQEYQDAMGYYYNLHVCRLKQPWPKEITDTFQNIHDDDTVYLTMNGPSEFFVTGNLKSWNIKNKLGEIDVTTLLINGFYDEATDEVIEPFFDTIKSRVRWIQFAKSSHMPHWEERERFMHAVYRFLK